MTEEGAAVVEKKVVLLISSYIRDPVEDVNMRRLRHMLTAKGVPFEEFDGALAENKEMRDRFFEISGKRGKYPQVFFMEGETIEFVGDYDEMESLNDNAGIPADILAQHPEIRTFESVFGELITK